MAKATGSIQFTSLPDQYTKITINDGQSGAFSELILAILTESNSSPQYWYAGASDSNHQVDGNAANFLPLYRESGGALHTKPHFFINFKDHDGAYFADWRDKWSSTGGSEPFKIRIRDHAGDVVDLDFYAQDGETAFGASDRLGTGTYTQLVRKNSATSYTIMVPAHASYTYDYKFTGAIDAALDDVVTNSTLAITNDIQGSSRFNRILSTQRGSAGIGLSVTLMRYGSASWTSLNSSVMMITGHSNSANGYDIAHFQHLHETVYAPFSEDIVGSSGSTMSASEFATYVKDAINAAGIAITATVSGDTVSLENDAHGTAGNQTITVTNTGSGSTNTSVSGLSGGSAEGGGGGGGGDTVAKTMLNNSRLAISTALLPQDTSAAKVAADLGSSSMEWGDLYMSDGKAIKLGDDQDVTLTHVADAGILVNSTMQLQFQDSGTYIHSSADAALDLVSDGSVNVSVGAAGMVLKGTTPKLTIGDAGAEDTFLVFDGNAQDYRIGLDDGTDKLEIGVGATHGTTTAMTIDASQQVAIIATTAASSTTTGAFTVAGGASIAADLYVGDDLELDSDGAKLGFGADSDVSLTHVADTGLLLNGTMALQFNDASQYINAPSATVLDINATDEVEINATLCDINANLDVSGTYTGGGLMTVGGNIVIPDDGTIGSASDTNAVAISSGGVVSVSATTAASSKTTGALTVAGGISTQADLYVGDDLMLDSDSAVLGFGDDGDVTLTHSADAGLVLNSGMKLFFRDAGDEAVYSVSDGVLGLVAGSEIDLTATSIDINGAADISGNLTIGGNLTVSGTTTTVDTTNLVVKDKLVTLNDGGAASSGTGVGLEIEEDGSATGYFKTDGTGDWTIKGAGSAANAVLTLDVNSTKTMTVAGALNIEADSIINQDLSSDSTAAQFGVLTLTTRLAADAAGGIDIGASGTGVGDVYIADDKKLKFGNGNDFTMEYDEDGTDTMLLAGAAVRLSDDQKLEFGVGGDASFEYDEDGTDTLLYAGASMRFSDDVKLEFGTGGDASFEYDEDGNDVLLYAGANLRISDDIKIEFGSGGDAGIEYDEDGTDQLRIHQPAAGVVIAGTNPKLVIGDAGAEDTMLVFDGNAQDFRMGLDDGTDKLEIGVGSAHGTTTAMTIDASQQVAITATTAASSTTSGALTVAGGASVAADLYVGDDLELDSDGAKLGFGADSDVSLTHVADAGLLLNSTRYISFQDAGTKIWSSEDGQLDLQSDGTMVDSILLNGSAGGVKLISALDNAASIHLSGYGMTFDGGDENDTFQFNNSAVGLEAISAPSSTSAKLYNVGGVLYWAGARIGAQAGDGILDTSGTFSIVSVEFAAMSSSANTIVTGNYHAAAAGGASANTCSFTGSGGACLTGSVQVYLNGMLLTRSGSVTGGDGFNPGYDYRLDSLSAPGKIFLEDGLDSDDVLTVRYIAKSA